MDQKENRYSVDDILEEIRVKKGIERKVDLVKASQVEKEPGQDGYVTTQFKALKKRLRLEDVDTSFIVEREKRETERKEKRLDAALKEAREVVKDPAPAESAPEPVRAVAPVAPPVPKPVERAEEPKAEPAKKPMEAVRVEVPEKAKGPVLKEAQRQSEAPREAQKKPFAVHIPETESHPVRDRSQETRVLDLGEAREPKVSESVDISEPGDSLVDRLKQAREKKIKDFVLLGDIEEDDDEADEPENQVEEINEYNTYADTEAIAKDIRTLQAGLWVKLILTGIAAAILGVLTAFNQFGVELFPILLAKNEPMIFVAVNLIVTLFACITCATVIFGGLSSMVRFKPDADSLVALLMLGCVVQNTMLMFSPEKVLENGSYIYSFIAVLGLFFNTVGKLSIVSRVRRNFKLVSSNYDKYQAYIVKNHKSLTRLFNGISIELPNACTQVKAGFLSRFLDYSYSQDPVDTASRPLTLFAFAGSLVVAGINFFLTRDTFTSISALVATLAICAPLSMLLCANFPLSRMSKELSRWGAMVSGYRAVDEYYDIDSIIVREKDLFPQDTILLHGIKTFSGRRIDEVIIEAGSLACAADGGLGQVFLKVVEGRSKIFKDVTGLVTEDGKGVSGWLGPKRVLLGSKALLEQYDIDAPSKDFEDRYAKDGTDIIYLASAGELAGMFVISYQPEEGTVAALQKLVDNDIRIMISHSDPNLTKGRLSDLFLIDEDMFYMIPSRASEEVRAITRPRPVLKASIANIGTFESFAYGLVAAIRSRSAIMAALTVQTIGIILGFLLLLVLTVTSGLAQMNPVNLLIYQAFWLILTVFIPKLRKL